MYVLSGYFIRSPRLGNNIRVGVGWRRSELCSGNTELLKSHLNLTIFAHQGAAELVEFLSPCNVEGATSAQGSLHMVVGTQRNRTELRLRNPHGVSVGLSRSLFRGSILGTIELQRLPNLNNGCEICKYWLAS